MAIEVHCSRITFNDGTSIEVEAGYIILIVGANNSGKSLSLRNINEHATNTLNGPQAVTSVTILRHFDKHELWDSVSSQYNIKYDGNKNAYIHLRGYNIYEANLDVVTSSTGPLGVIGPLFFALLDGAARLTMAAATSSIDFGTQDKIHPLHFLHEDRVLREKLSSWFQRAFGTEIAMDLVAGNVVPLHVGPGAALRDGENEITSEYRQRLKTIPRLDSQGDGMKSFAGLLVYTLLMHQSVYLIDEPEAFLHPPQARLLGRLLAEQLSDNRQLIAATHSADFVRGVLESNRAKVKVIRLRREGNINIAKMLTSEQIKEIWADPSLRYSNILDGMFHEKVVVCEADGDCRFYAAIADALRTDDVHPYVRDLMFTQAGGKGGIPKLVAALRCLDVPIAAVVDFDVIQQTGQPNAIITALGGNPEDYAADLKAVKDAINELGGKSVSATKAKITQIIDAVPDEAESFPPNVASDIRKQIKAAPGWERAKSIGIEFLKPGVQKSAGTKLLSELAKIGLHIVPCGELESFEQSITTSKNEWLAEVLSKHAGRFGSAPELRAASEFVRSFISA